MKEVLKKHTSEWCYTIFRIIVGILFFMHGSGKLFGWFSGPGMGFTGGLMTVAGVIELLAGLALVFGVFSRLAALGGSVVMIVAYFMAHAGNGWNPLANGGELALMYFAAFIVVMWLGNGAHSLECKITRKKKELF